MLFQVEASSWMNTTTTWSNNVTRMHSELRICEFPALIDQYLVPDDASIYALYVWEQQQKNAHGEKEPGRYWLVLLTLCYIVNAAALCSSTCIRGIQRKKVL